MTSVVDTSVKHFKSAMANAPVLSGAAGTLISLLDACLVDGFDLKTATSLVVSGGEATLSFSGTHSATVDSVILVAGSSLTALNGEQKVTTVGSDFVRFATAQADGTATGTITFKMAPLGWTKSFTGTNLAAYKSSDVEGTQMFLRIDDTNALNARVVGYEDMTGISTGTGPFPTNAQMSGGGYWFKSAAANTNPVTWYLFGDSRTFYIHTAPYSGAAGAAYTIGGTRGFGDMIALRPSGDAYACALGYSASTDYTNSPHYGSLDHGAYATIATPRSYSGLGSSQLTNSYPYIGQTSSASGMDQTLGAFPSTVDGSLLLSGRFLRTDTGNNTPRCNVPGIYTSPQNQVAGSLTGGDKIPGTGPLAGKTLMGVTAASSGGTSAPTSSNSGVTFIDITGPWR